MKSKVKRHRPVRGRPTAQQVSRINDVILAVATERFLATGYAATSMDAIASAAKVSKGTLYSRYPDKDALLRAVVEGRVAAWSEKARRQNPMPGNTLEERLKHYARTVMMWCLSEDVRALDRLLADAPQAARAGYELLYRRMVGVFADQIRELTAADSQPARNPERVALTIMGALSGWLRSETLVRTVSQGEAVAFAHDAIDMLLSGRAAW